MLLNFTKVFFGTNERWMGSYYHQYLHMEYQFTRQKIIYILNHATYILRFKIKAFQLNTGNEYSPHCLGKSRKCLFNLWESTHLVQFELYLNYTCKSPHIFWQEFCFLTLGYWKWVSFLSKMCSVDSAEVLTFHFLKKTINIHNM